MTLVFDPKRGLIVVPVELWGPSGSGVLQLALDTGATSTLVNVGMLVAIGYDPALTAERVQVTTGSGVEFAPRVVLQRVKALRQEHLGFLTHCHRVRALMASLGWTFCGLTLTIDFRAGV